MKLLFFDENGFDESGFYPRAVRDPQKQGTRNPFSHVCFEGVRARWSKTQK